MRFAWLKQNSADYVAVKQAFTHPLSLIRKAYNLAFWIFLIPFFTAMEYSTGFIVFTVIILMVLAIRLYSNQISCMPWCRCFSRRMNMGL
jgi:hypothetical protein